jgi:hypothetical protein
MGADIASTGTVHTVMERGMIQRMERSMMQKSRVHKSPHHNISPGRIAPIDTAGEEEEEGGEEEGGG